MFDFSLAGWLVLVVAYVALGRFRGSTWHAIIRMPVLILIAVLIEFAGPALLARHGDLRILVISMVLLAFGVSWGAWGSLGTRRASAGMATGEARASG